MVVSFFMGVDELMSSLGLFIFWKLFGGSLNDTSGCHFF